MHMYISIYNHIFNINETFPTISWTPGGHSRSTYAKLQREEYYTTSIHKLSQGTQKIQKLVAQHVRFFCSSCLFWIGVCPPVNLL